jgi:hypothetical protein
MQNNPKNIGSILQDRFSGFANVFTKSNLLTKTKIYGSIPNVFEITKKPRVYRHFSKNRVFIALFSLLYHTKALKWS